MCFFSVLCLPCLCARLFICALCSPAGKGLTSWLSSVCHFPIGILGQVWYLIVSIPDLCTITYFNSFRDEIQQTGWHVIKHENIDKYTENVATCITELAKKHTFKTKQ